jgi:hypothetical protein
MHRDKHGLIVQADGDGGDTCQRVGMYYYGRYLTEGRPRHLRDEFMAEAAQLEVPRQSGIIVRHPYQKDYRPPGRPPELPTETFRSDPASVSRDQTDPLIIALGAFGEIEYLRRLWKEFVGRGFRYQNGDVPLLQSWSGWIRAFGLWYLYPFLWFFDLGLIGSSVVKCMDDDPDHSDDNNHMIRMFQSTDTLATPMSWFARRYWARNRPRTYGSYVGEYHQDGVTYKYPGESNYVMGAFVWYHRPQNKGNPEIAEVYRDQIARLF